ncbi:MAG: RDD family protein [Candidatus Hydrogenedentes bacterium]|nr:RDD family protein [Candidatus Hydrogenedentota bacterium]
MARMIDGFVVGAVFAVLGVGMALLLASMGAADPNAAQGAGVVIVLMFNAMALGLPVIYNAFFVIRSGATPGKMAMGLKVVLPSGCNVSTGQAWGRAFADLLTQITMGLGYLMVIFDEEKRALHDHICGTRVISTR